MSKLYQQGLKGEPSNKIGSRNRHHPLFSSILLETLKTVLEENQNRIRNEHIEIVQETSSVLLFCCKCPKITENSPNVPPWRTVIFDSSSGDVLIDFGENALKEQRGPSRGKKTIDDIHSIRRDTKHKQNRCTSQYISANGANCTTLSLGESILGENNRQLCIISYKTCGLVES